MELNWIGVRELIILWVWTEEKCEGVGGGSNFMIPANVNPGLYIISLLD